MRVTSVHEKDIGDSGMQYIYKRNGKKKKKSHKSPLRPEISNVFPSRDVNLPHSLKPHQNSPQGLQRENKDSVKQYQVYM